jgi:Flp pilus assembly protein TadD
VEVEGESFVRDISGSGKSVDPLRIDSVVSDGVLCIDFLRQLGNPHISAIEVQALDKVATAGSLQNLVRDDPELLTAWGQQLAQAGHHREAVRWLERAQLLGGSGSRLEEVLASSRKELWPDLATFASMDAAYLKETGPLQERRVPFDGARLAAFSVVARGDDAEARRAYFEGRMLQQADRHSEALPRLEEAARLQPDACEPPLRLAESLRALGEIEAAERQLRKALEGPARGSKASWDAWFELVLVEQGKTLSEALSQMPTPGEGLPDPYAERCRKALEERIALGVERVERVDRLQWPPVTTLAYWRFEEGEPGQILLWTDHSKNAVVGALDSSGNGNVMHTHLPGSSPRFGTDVPSSALASGSPNRRSLDDTLAPASSLPTRGIYTRYTLSGAPKNNVTRWPFPEWTFEVSFNLVAVDRDQGIMTRGDFASAGLPTPMLLQVLRGGILQLAAVDSTQTRRIITAGDPIEAGHWYHVAAVSDGATLCLFVKPDGGGAYQFRGESTFEGALSGEGVEWIVGRGARDGRPIFDALGFIDEVRISAVALPPERFLFAPR